MKQVLDFAVCVVQVFLVVICILAAWFAAAILTTMLNGALRAIGLPS